MTIKKILFLSLTLLFVTIAFIFPCKSGQTEISLEGKIKTNGVNWLIQANDKDYVIKFDQEELDKTGIKLVEGELIRVHGTLAGDDITPCEIYFQGKYYTFTSNHSESGCSGRHRRGR